MANELDLVIKAQNLTGQAFAQARADVKKFSQDAAREAFNAGSPMGWQDLGPGVKWRPGGGAAPKMPDVPAAATQNTMAWTESLARVVGVTRMIQGGLQAATIFTAIARGDSEKLLETAKQLPLGIGAAVKAGEDLVMYLSGAAEAQEKAAKAAKEQAEYLEQLKAASEGNKAFAEMVGDIKAQAGSAGLEGLDRDLAAAEARERQGLKTLAKEYETQRARIAKVGGTSGVDEAQRARMRRELDSQYGDAQAALADARAKEEGAARQAEDKRQADEQAKRAKAEADQRKDLEDARQKAEKEQRDQAERELQIENETRTKLLRLQGQHHDAELAQIREHYRQRIAEAKTATEREALERSQQVDEAVANYNALRAMKGENREIRGGLAAMGAGIMAAGGQYRGRSETFAFREETALDRTLRTLFKESDEQRKAEAQRIAGLLEQQLQRMGVTGIALGAT